MHSTAYPESNITRPYVVHYVAERSGMFSFIGEIPGEKWLCVRSRRRPTPHELREIAAKAMREGIGCRTAILMEEDDSEIRLTTFKVEPTDLPALRHNISYPGPSLPILSYRKDFISVDSVPEISRYSLDIVNMKGELFVCKFGNSSAFPVEKELANYYLLRSSPYVLKLVALVRREHPYFTLENPYVQAQAVVDGFLLPFVGTLSTLWLPGEWSVEEKETLAVHVIDAVSDIELRGVYLSDVKSTNILLTPEGMKIIDLDDVGYTWPNWLRLVNQKQPRQRTTAGLAATLCQLFTERNPEPFDEWPGVPSVFAAILRRCTRGEFHSVSHLRNDTWDSTQETRARNVTIADLVEKRRRRLSSEAHSYNEWWLGRWDDEPTRSWFPTFQDKILPPLPDPPTVKLKKPWMRSVLSLRLT